MRINTGAVKMNEGSDFFFFFALENDHFHVL